MRQTSLWDDFILKFQQIQELGSLNRNKGSDSGNVSDAEVEEKMEVVVDDVDSGLKTGEKDDQDQRKDDHDQRKEDATTTNGDVSPGIFDEGVALPQGPLSGITLPCFANITPMDGCYYSMEDGLVDVYNPVLDSLPEVIDSRMQLPRHLKVGLKSAVKESLYSVILQRCSQSCSELVLSFTEIYLKQLKFHTDYLLLQKPSHCISLYLDNLFQQITFPESLFYSKINLDMYHFDDSADVRACIVYSAQENKDPVTILSRLHIFYEDLDPFSRLLIDPTTKQVFGDAFYFLLRLKYSKWILDSVQLKTFLPKNADKVTARLVLKLKHQLFCLRFRCMRAVVVLLEYAMFQLQEATQDVNEASSKAKDFNDLKHSLETFSHSIKLITLQDKQTVIQLVVSTAMAIQKLCLKRMETETKESNGQEVRCLEKNVLTIESIVSFFSNRINSGL